MKKILLVACCWLLVAGSFGQTISQKLQKAFQQFTNDSQLKHAISSLYVIDAKTGKVVFDKNSQIGLVPASTQKIITAATAFELLGKDYRYETELGYDGETKNGVLKGTLFLTGSGDPTLGSWRYFSTRDTFFMDELIGKMKLVGIKSITGNLIIDESKFDLNSIPDGWIWQDIGNYYGAGSKAFNWRENQYDITFIPGNKVGDIAGIDTVSTPEWQNLINTCMTGSRGSGDNAYIYFIPGDKAKLVKGTVPAGVKRFSISGTDLSPTHTFSYSFMKYAIATNFFSSETQAGVDVLEEPDSSQIKKIYTHYSPTLDSIIYWLNKKSINLYGEALIKTFAYEKQGFGSTDSGIAIVKDFWKQKGLDDDELNIVDGSGLSPLNRVTTHAQVEVLKYAKTKDWFPYFYDGLPEYNNMKMKSGTIRGVKGFTGYHASKSGHEYIFSFLVNNYTGPSSALVNKMYRVLNSLK